MSLKPSDAEGCLSIQTPLGAIALGAVIDAVDVSDLRRSAEFDTATHDRLFCWTHDRFQAELLLCKPRLEMPEPMRVDDCRAGLWRLLPTSPAEKIEFTCLWKPGYHWQKVGPESGQGVDAQTWDDGQVEVTIGTEDAERLSHRALHHGNLPGRWSDLLADAAPGRIDPVIIDPVIYEEQGFRIKFPLLEAGELCQVQFVAAWSSALQWSKDAIEYSGTWFAVDVLPQTILVSIGCL